MSIFQRTTVECPGCGLERAFDLVVSVSADRRPDLRAAILDGSFQRERCPACGVSFRVEPEFSYIDLARGQYIGAWPQAQRARPRDAVARTQAGFDLAFGAKAGGAARAIGDGLTLRVVFGWPALTEKLRAREAGLDDQALEALKVALIAQLAAAPLPGRQELRLLAADEASLRFGWVDGEGADGGQGRAGGVGQRLMTLPRAAIDEIAADRPAWQALLDEVVDGPAVDFQREMPVV